MDRLNSTFFFPIRTFFPNLRGTYRLFINQVLVVDFCLIDKMEKIVENNILTEK